MCSRPTQTDLLALIKCSSLKTSNVHSRFTEEPRLIKTTTIERRLAKTSDVHVSGLDIGLVGPVARGASRFENLLAPQKTYWPGGPVDLKTYWPPKKLTGPYLKTKLARRKTICINLQFAHRPIIKLFRSHPRNIFSNMNGNPLARRASRKSIVVARTGPTT